MILPGKPPLIVRRRFREQFDKGRVFPLRIKHRGEFGQLLQLGGDVFSVGEGCGVSETHFT